MNGLKKLGSTSKLDQHHLPIKLITRRRRRMHHRIRKHKRLRLTYPHTLRPLMTSLACTLAIAAACITVGGEGWSQSRACARPRCSSLYCYIIGFFAKLENHKFTSC